MKKITTVVLVLAFIISGSDGFAQKIASGRTFALAICSDSTVWAWGENTWGNLGDNSTTQRIAPIQVHGPGNVGFLKGFIAVAGSEYSSLGLKADGTVWAWGDNHYGQLGDSTIILRKTPVQVHGPGNVGFLTGITAITGMGHHWLALKNDSTVWAWGNCGYGQLGINSTIGGLNGVGSSVPVQVHGTGNVGYLTGIIAIGASYGHSVALKSDGTVWTWGENGNWELGDGTQIQRWTPVQVHGTGNVGFLTGVTAITAGDDNCLALKNDSTVWSWGFNVTGLCGDNTVLAKPTPVQVHGPGNVGFLTGVKSVFGSLTDNFAVKYDGTVYGWGANSNGQIGDSTNVNKLVPEQVHGQNNIGFFTGASTMSGGLYYTFAMKTDGTLWSWGNNSNGQLGDSTLVPKWTPIHLNGLCAGLPPVASFQSSDTAFCDEAGKCINFFDHSTNGATSWKWLFPGATPDSSILQNPTNICYTTPGTYAVTLIVTNANGTDTLSVSPMITFGSTPNAPTITRSGGDTLICSHASSYQWFFNGSPIPFATDSFYVATVDGTYNVQITDGIGCSRLGNGFLFTAVNELSDHAFIKIFPNPLTSSSILQLNIQLKDAEVVIYDMLGKEMLSKRFSGNKMEIERGSLESGVYFVRVTAEKRQWIEKMMVE